MSKLIYRCDGMTISFIPYPLIPRDHVMLMYGGDVIVQNVDDPNVLQAEPRTDYARVYNVIPDNATEDQAVEIFRQGWRRAHETAGGSYDDAGHGLLSNKTAVLWGVEHRAADFLNWYNRWYPGVKLSFMPLPEQAMPAKRREVEP